MEIVFQSNKLYKFGHKTSLIQAKYLQQVCCSLVCCRTLVLDAVKLCILDFNTNIQKLQQNTNTQIFDPNKWLYMLC